MRELCRSVFRFTLPAVLAVMLFSCAAIAQEGEETHVVILATSDMHGDVWGYSYEDNAPTDNSGMSRLYTYIKEVREENPVVFLSDAGDAIQGTIMTDDIANKEPEKEHPVMAAMNYMGYDAMTLGNHEFNWGIDTMKTILSQAKFPVLGANILNPDGSCVTGHGWTIVERGGIRLAIIGVCTPFIRVWDENKPGISQVTFEDPYESVGKALEEIGDQADLVLVSAHMGEEAEFDMEGGTDSALKILEENPEVDILQTAHMHVTVQDEWNGVPVVGVRKNGREIARIDVTLDQDRNVKEITTQIVDMSDYEPSEEIRQIDAVKALHEQTIRFVDGIGEDGQPEEPIGTTTAKFQPENQIRGMPEAWLQDTAVPDLILKVELLNSGADVASCALFKDTSDLPEGDIRYGNIFDIYKYDNTLCTVDVTGKELRDYMEWSAEYFNQWKPGDINISYDPDHPSFLYDLFAGIDYEIDLSRPKGERIRNVMFKGEPLKDDQILKLAINNYRYSSSLKGNHLIHGRYDWESSCSIRDMIVAYFHDHSPVEPVVDHNWRIVGTDLSEGDPRREELIGYINDGWLPIPYYESYNLADYDALCREAEANRAKGEKSPVRESH